MKTNRCYYCGNANATTALFDDVCLLHFLKLSFQLAVLQARNGRLTSHLFWELFFRDLPKHIWRVKMIALFVWTVLLISVLQLLGFTWLFRSRLAQSIQGVLHLLWQKTHCPWCWKALHLRTQMPSGWTSCMCQSHYRTAQKSLVTRRATRTTVAALPSCEAACQLEPMRVEVLV